MGCRRCGFEESTIPEVKVGQLVVNRETWETFVVTKVKPFINGEGMWGKESGFQDYLILGKRLNKKGSLYKNRKPELVYPTKSTIDSTTYWDKFFIRINPAKGEKDG